MSPKLHFSAPMAPVCDPPLLRIGKVFMSQTVYDALVIGSGAAGSFAVKELTAQGLSVLLLEAGPAITPKDFDPTRKKEPASSINIWERARATLKGQPIQA